MNFVTSGNVSRFSPKIWGNYCCKDSQIKPIYIKINSKNNKNAVYDKSLSFQWSNLQCLSRKLPRLILWTQVRFQNGYPKFHRDIKHPGFDDYRKDEFKDLSKTTWHSGDEKKGYTYVIGYFGLLMGMYCTKSEVIHYVMSMAAPADVIALASIEIDIGNIQPGLCSSFKWRGKPLFIKHRTAAEISAEARTPLTQLKDPETPEQRTQKPEWLIVIGICTHLGCVPVPNSGDWAGGFYCPCHGSHYDNVGRARKGPAPTNLEVPPYKFITDTLVLVG